MRKAVSVLALSLGLVLGSLIGVSLYGFYYGDKPQGLINQKLCYEGRQITLALGTNKSMGFLYASDDWGPPYFRMSLHLLAWKGGALSYLYNAAQVCDLTEDEKLYQHKETWIDTHNTEWLAYVKENPQEGKTWYGRGWKRILRQINRQTTSE